MDKKAFKLGALFTSQTGDTDIKKEHINGEGWPVVSSGNDNTGILGCSDIEACVIPKNTITVDMFGNVYYRDFDYKMVTHARVFALLPNGFSLDEKTGLYFATSLAWLSHVFSYNNMCSYKKIKDMEIEIPVIKSPDPDHEYTVEDIDFEYMKQRIAELEKQRIAELEKQRIAELDAYLTASGLNNYKLTDEDKNALSSSTRQTFKEFDLSVLFDISTTKSVDKNKLDFVADGEYDFIGRTPVNWGIQGKLHKLSFEPNPKDSFSLIQVGETVALWREKEWYASQNLFLLNPKIDEVKENKLYFQGVINKEMSRYGKEYSSYPTMKSLAATKILLPVVKSPDTDHEYTPADIDWQYMERYIRAIEKLAIADVVRYKDRTIVAAKQVIDI